MLRVPLQLAQAAGSARSGSERPFVEKRWIPTMTAAELFELFPGDPSIQIIPTLGPKVYKYYLHWVIWAPRVTKTYTWDTSTSPPGAPSARVEALAGCAGHEATPGAQPV